MEIRKRALGLSLGLIWGLAILLGTWWLLIFGYKGEIWARLSQFFIGYSFTYGGAIIGFIWAFVYGFITGVLMGWFYDTFSKMLYKSKS